VQDDGGHARQSQSGLATHSVAKETLLSSHSAGRCASILILSLFAVSASAAEISEATLRAADAEQMRIILEGDAEAQQTFMHPNYIINGPSGHVLKLLDKGRGMQPHV
jgi:hypothetical protein